MTRSKTAERPRSQFFKKNETVAIVLPFFHMGGVERWALNISRGLSYQNIEAQIFVCGKLSACPADFGPEFRSIKLNIVHNSMQLFLSVKNFDLVITALTKFNFLGAIFGYVMNRDFVSSVHVTLQQQASESLFKVKIRRLLYRFIVYLSHRTLAVSYGLAEELSNLTGAAVDSKKLLVIQNPCFSRDQLRTVSLARLERDDTLGSPRPKVIAAAGRLHPQKGFDILLAAIASENLSDPKKVQFKIYGEGAEGESLKMQAKLLGLRNVEFCGISKMLMRDLMAADIFVLPSRYEGFGNVLAEALAAGCYCVAFDICHGPREILDNGRFGILVQNISHSELGAALAGLCSPTALGMKKTEVRELSGHLDKFTTEYVGRRAAEELFS